MDSDALGLFAGALTTIAFVPQVLRILHTRSAHDISWLLFGILAKESGHWLWYGVRVNSMPLMITNLVTLTLQLLIFCLKLRYCRGKRQGVAVLGFLGGPTRPLAREAPRLDPYQGRSGTELATCQRRDSRRAAHRSVRRSRPDPV
jgi:MtN3 and saliva related transmembrane protein